MTTYSENYKRKMDSFFNKKEPEKSITKEEKISLEDKAIEKKPIEKREFKRLVMNPQETSRINKNRILNIIFFIIGIVVLGLIIWLIMSNSVKIIYVFILIILLFFILFYFFHRYYEKAVFYINPKIILFIVYLILITNIILQIRYYSVEWAFLGFLICAVICYDSKIDSRFLILPALFLLGYVPFLLIAKYQVLAELLAVYVYYFLVLGVGLQFIEYIRKTEPRLNFEEVIRETITGSNWIITSVFLGLIEIIIIILNRFYNLIVWEYTVLYFFIISIIFYVIKNYFYEKKE